MPEEQKTKAEAFLQDYKELVDKHQQDFATYPVFVPDGNGGFKVIVQTTPVDISKMSDSIESPFSPQE